jgi:type I restriction enzyme M protein
VLFLDARLHFKQVTRAIREFAPEQLEFLANIVRLYRGQTPEFEEGSKAMLAERFAGGKYSDVAGLVQGGLRWRRDRGAGLEPESGPSFGMSGWVERAADEFDFARSGSAGLVMVSPRAGRGLPTPFHHSGPGLKADKQL